MSNIYAMADTWNNAATVFTAIQMNVTDTASAASSLLLDLQVGGVSRFNVSKSGNTNIPGGSLNIGSSQIQSGGVVVLSTPGAAVYMGAALDVVVSRKSANIISIDKAAPADSLGGIAPQTKAGAFVAADFPVGSWMVGRDTTNLTTRLYYNNAGTLMTVALA